MRAARVATIHDDVALHETSSAGRKSATHEKAKSAQPSALRCDQTRVIKLMRLFQVKRPSSQFSQFRDSHDSNGSAPSKENAEAASVLRGKRGVRAFVSVIPGTG